MNINKKRSNIFLHLNINICFIMIDIKDYFIKNPKSKILPKNYSFPTIF